MNLRYFSRFRLMALALSPALLALLTPMQAMGQSLQPPPSAVPAPGELELAKMIWSTMSAVDHANRAGNYSVLRDMSAPSFQQMNDSAKLAQVFAGLRASNVDLSNALLLAPTYSGPAGFVQQDVIRISGAFLLRPTAISFDLYYQWYNGEWRLFGVSIEPLRISAQQPEGPSASAAGSLRDQESGR